MEIDDSSPTEARLAAAPSTRLALLVMSASGVFTIALPATGAITIGRGADCDVRIDDPKASRRHAVVRVGERCTVEDLGSLNGTRVGDRALAPNAPLDLRPGEMVSIGTTVLLLQTTAPHAAPVRLWSQAAFEERFDRERADAEKRGAPLGLLRLTLDEGAAGALGAASTSTRRRVADDVTRAQRLDRTLRECLRPSDVVGSIGPGVYEILLPRTPPEEAAGIASALQMQLHEGGVPCALSLASFPRDGASHESLARRAVSLDDDEEPPASVAVGQGMQGRLTPMIARIAAGEINVLILGETGVGKEVLARTIHAQSPRASAPLVCINCAALSESLLESELFGHERGAFTGATQAKPGLLESADHGIVFLDEIGEMPMTLQAKLLRVLEQREVQRVGSLRPRPIDVRFLAATNRDLEAEIAHGRFRQDLYFRLNGIAVVIPPLRERTDEIAPLARAFVKQACERSRRRVVPRIAPAVFDLLRRYAWPGNVRELRNMMDRAVLLTSGDEITIESFPSEMLSTPVVALRASAAPPRAPVQATVPPPAHAAPESDPDVTSEISGSKIDAAILAIPDERERIVAALRACGGNQTQAARLLGVSRRTLVSRLGEYELPRPRKR